MSNLYLLLLSLILFFFTINVCKSHEGFMSYNQCLASGYTKEFCVQTPVSVFGPAGCMCPDGSIGMIHPGLRGECLCSRWY